MNKHIKIDKAKLKEAITVGEEQVKESEPLVSNKVNCVDIELDGIDETEFLTRMSSHISDLELVGGKTTGVISKDSFIKIFKYTNDLAKFMDKNGKAESQEKRLVHFQ